MKLAGCPAGMTKPSPEKIKLLHWYHLITKDLTSTLQGFITQTEPKFLHSQPDDDDDDIT